MSSYVRPGTRSSQPGSFGSQFLAVFLGSLLALVVFGVGVKLYVEYKIASAIESMKAVRDKK